MRIIDLFSGAGGLTFGFYYRIKNNRFVRNRKNSFVFANEYDIHAATAFSNNFPNINMLNCDVRTISENAINDLVGEKRVDLIIGGPPCQSFSTIGQRRFDDTARLYEEYVRILRIVKPKMFLFENVKGLLSMKEIFYKQNNEKIVYKDVESTRNGKKVTRKVPVIERYGDLIINKIKEEFKNIDKDFGYNIYYKVLNAVDYGVPENRERVFIIGIDKSLNLKWDFPAPLKKTYLTIDDAISDLPKLKEGSEKKKYTKKAKNMYQELMRGDNKIITQHYCGVYGDKIRTVIKNVKQGQGKDDFNVLVDKGIIDKKYKLTSGFSNTYGRLIKNQPSTTITNNLSTPSALRCIHYSQDRALSPREGARIQSFPDWFEFSGNKDQVTSQIGNAVPPLLSLALSNQIEKTLKG